MRISFFLPGIPPTITQQEHKVRVVKGKPVVYEPQELKTTRDKLCGYLMMARKKYGPPAKLLGPVRLVTKWFWPELHAGDGYSWKVTRPDTDNLIKMFKDCMTKVGYWKDDAQVVSEITEKMRGPQPGIYVEITTMEDDDDGSRDAQPPG